MDKQIYIANKHSKEVHTSNCAWVKRINPKNTLQIDLKNEDLLSYLLKTGYNPCGHCLIKNQDRLDQRKIPITNTKEPLSLTKKDIEVAAYFNWRERGSPIGDELTDWIKAESLLTKR
ncbi:MAG: DUF2934 domain-containing protein [Gammaproteobacteria bacterium]|nr:DUF2934 domain-containing protein [Gammaproteobacteria bacterium]